MLESLPNHLSERIRVVGERNYIQNSGPVIVWLKSTHRFHENPAIDVARIIAHQNDLPLLIYHGIDERYPWASLRHHNSLLDGAVDVSRLCEKNGIRHVLHVARDGHRQSVMKNFATLASLIITDLFPIPPWDEWVRNVAQIARCPVIEVDCHCVIPMPLYGKSVDRPFKFRSATKKLRKERIQRSWPNVELTPSKYTGDLPFVPVDIETEVADMKARFELLKQCNIDPTVIPVWKERGGEISAISKWQEFLDNGLSGYSRRRNNAADPNGVSRLSSAFHYGFLSPMKVAREAAAIGTKSADKYLDELLIFREHAWHHIYFSDNPYSPSNLPGWSLGSWRRAEGDVRTLFPEHKLEYSESPSDLWNDCQRSLTRHGELHNNLRMTWGKAFPHWTESLEKSLELSQKLNDKYALDGRDPSSIVGVQWCHGLFDRPFEPSAPVMGLIRKRDIETHKSRLDFITYRNYVNRINGNTNIVYIVKGNPLLQAFVSRILEDNGYNVVMASPIQSLPNMVFSKLDLRKLPTWIKDRIDSILQDSETSDYESFANTLSKAVTKITISEQQPLFSDDLKTLLASDILEPRFRVIEIGDGSSIDYAELKNDMPLNAEVTDLKDYSQKKFIGELLRVIWKLTEIIWNDNCNHESHSYSVQATLF